MAEEGGTGPAPEASPLGAPGVDASGAPAEAADAAASGVDASGAPAEAADAAAAEAGPGEPEDAAPGKELVDTAKEEPASGAPEEECPAGDAEPAPATAAVITEVPVTQSTSAEQPSSAQEDSCDSGALAKSLAEIQAAKEPADAAEAAIAADASEAAIAADASATEDATHEVQASDKTEGEPASPVATAPACQVSEVQVPERRINVDTARDGHAKAEGVAVEVTAERLRVAVDDAVAELYGGLGNTPRQEEVRLALADWKARLEEHVKQLEHIMQPSGPAVNDANLIARSLSGGVAEATAEGAKQAAAADVEAAPPAEVGLPEGQDPAAEATEEDAEAKATEILDGLQDVQHMRHQLECHREGRDVDEVPSAWADPEEAEREVAELRRVRRQIRYLFGGMIGSLPESSLRVDDLLSEQGDAAEASTSPSNARPHGQPAAVSLHEMAMESPKPPKAPPARPAENQVRDTMSESMATTNSSATTLDSQRTNRGDRSHRDSEERRRERRERKERKERKHRHHREEEQMKKDDGAMPPKQWNWAEEVVKASLDPLNQWEFPSVAGHAASPSAHAPRREKASWEQPRQMAPFDFGAAPPRGNDIALRARERAEEVLRSERGRQQRLFEAPDALDVVSFR